MRLAIGVLLSLAGPITLGWLLVRTLLPRSLFGLRASLGAGLGTGVIGAVYYLALLITRSSWWSLVLTESILIGAIPLLMRRGARAGRPEAASAGGVVKSQTMHTSHLTTPPARFLARLRRSLVLASRAPVLTRRGGENPQLTFLPILNLLVLTLAVLAAIWTIASIAATPHGQWDAMAVWNLKARFIYLTASDPLARIMDPALWDTQPDYPLLLPSLVARGWQYAGRDTVVIPISLAVLFTASTVGVVFFGLKMLTRPLHAQLATVVLLSTPFFFRQGMAQYADVLVCCYITSAVLLYCLYDAEPAGETARLPLLAGIAAGLAACTKNEGLLFVLVLAAVRLMVLAWRRFPNAARRELIDLASGAAFGVVVLAAFKHLYSPPNPIVQGITGRVIIDRMGDWTYHARILKAFAQNSLRFGEWWICPLLLLMVHVAVARWKSAKAPSPGWTTAAWVTAGLISGYYSVYLLSPYDLDWHLGTSLDRLLFQIWPTALVLYALLGKEG
jgi:hypothetical protein